MKKNYVKLPLFCFLSFLGSVLISLLVSSCEKHYLVIKRETIDRNSLASTFVGSPDPRQENPITGQELICEWYLPSEAVEKPLFLTLYLVYRNYTKQKLRYLIQKRRGMITYSLLGEEYCKKKGLLTYKAEITNKEGKVLKKWQQQLWTNLILSEEDP